MNARSKAVVQILVVVGFLFASVFNPVGVAAQTDPNFADWDNPQWAEEFAIGSRNAVFSTTNPLPKASELPQEVKDALTHGMVAVLIEPWRVGCPEPLTDPNCNVGYVKSFTDWSKLYRTVYGKIEANKGNIGPWTNGSVHLTRIPELAAGIATETDWGMFANGDLKITFAENQLLPVEDPTAGANSFRLIEPWRHTCIGDDSTDLDCNVGKSGVFPDWQSLRDFLSTGGWTRGSIMTQDKVILITGNLPEVVVVPPVVEQPIESVKIQSDVVSTTLNPIFGYFTGVVTWLLIGLALMYLVMLLITIWAVWIAWRIHWAIGLVMLFVALVVQYFLGIIGTALVLLLGVLLILRPRFLRTQIAAVPTPTPTPTPTTTP